MDCCSTVTDNVHKSMVRLCASQDRTTSWQVLKGGNLTALKNDLEAVRLALDLLLDLVELYVQQPNTRGFALKIGKILPTNIRIRDQLPE